MNPEQAKALLALHGALYPQILSAMDPPVETED